MINKIHILGASGSGTTTLAKALSKDIGFKHFDTDNYYWLPSGEPFTQKRDIKERQIQLKEDLENYTNWVLSGSLCGWGDIFIPYFDLVVYLWIPSEIRISRLMKREKDRYGSEIEMGGSRYESYNEFIRWASKYDEAGVEMRSKKLHQAWISKLECPVLKLEGDMKIEERVKIVVESIKNMIN